MKVLKQIFLACLSVLLVLWGSVQPALATTYEVKMGTDKGQLAFEPKVLTVKAGDTVRWINNKAYPHNVVFSDPNLSHPKLLLKPNQVVETTFNQPGEYDYYCTPHRGAGMVGRIIVQ